MDRWWVVGLTQFAASLAGVIAVRMHHAALELLAVVAVCKIIHVKAVAPYVRRELHFGFDMIGGAALLHQSDGLECESVAGAGSAHCLLACDASSLSLSELQVFSEMVDAGQFEARDPDVGNLDARIEANQKLSPSEDDVVTLEL